MFPDINYKKVSNIIKVCEGAMYEVTQHINITIMIVELGMTANLFILRYETVITG